MLCDGRSSARRSPSIVSSSSLPVLVTQDSRLLRFLSAPYYRLSFTISPTAVFVYDTHSHYLYPILSTPQSINMKAVFSNLLALTLVASHIAPVALAAPVASSKQEQRSLKAVGAAVAGGIASGAAGALVSDLLNKREPDAEEHDARSLKAVGAAVAGGIASGAAGAIVGDLLNKRSLTAIENFFGNLFNKRSEPSGLMVDTETGVIYMEVPDANEGRSLKAIGTAVAGGVASLAAGAVANHFLGDKRSEPGLFVDSETGTLYMVTADENETRSLKAIGTAVAGGIASGAAGAIVSNLFNKRSDGVFVDTETGTIYMDVPDATEARSLKAIGTAVAGGIASGAAGAVISNLLGRDASDLLVDTETGVIYMDVPDANEGRSLKAIGTAVAGGVASLAAGGIANHFLGNKRSDLSGLMVDTETGTIYADVPDANEGRSLKAIGTAVAGGIASGVAGAVVGDLFNKRSLTAIENFFGNLFNKRSELSGLMVDSETGVIYMEVPDANEGRSLKAVGAAVAGGVASGAAGAIISNLLGRDASGLLVDTETGTIYMDTPDANEGRSLKAIGTAVAGGIASGVAGAVVSDIFNKREPEVSEALEARSLKAVGVAVAGGIASGAAGAIASNLLGRDASDLLYDTETGTIYMDIPDAVEGRSLKAVGAAVAGGIASGAAGAIVSDLLGKRAINELD
ncbi:hypothetical protein PENSPDRAFT_454581 [Peniophora sp. CONT]|nr:hypothetical protein PENSPDRAFT_454581 [Peniophora sp. CONT]